MRVLIVFNHPAPYKVELFNELAKSIDLDVIFERTKAKDRPIEFYQDNQYNFNVTFLKKGAFSNENSWTNELANYLKKHHQDYDLIIMNGYSTITEMKAINYLRRKAIPFVLFINGGIIKKDSFIKRKIKKHFISSASYYLSPSSESNEYLIHYGANKDNIYAYNNSTIHNADILVKPLSNKEKEELRKKYSLPESPLFVTASSFIGRKNIMQLLEVFKDRKENLLIIGEGPQKEKYEAFIKDNSMNNVKIIPFLPHQELLTLLGGCDYFITLSKEDIYGHTINEAFARGLPVIASRNIISAQKLIKDGENGYIVDLDNKMSIINALENIKNIDLENTLKAARENTYEAMADQLLKIYKQLVK